MKSKIKILFAMTSRFVMLSAIIMLSVVEAQAQAPQLFNYQGIARDTKGNPLSNQTMTLKLSVLPTADALVPEYEETQTVKTSEFGLYTLQIGNGSSTTLRALKDVKWETGNKYIKVGIDPTGGTHYVDAGTSQLLSVPYAIYANKAGVVATAETDKTRTGAVNSNAAHTVGDANYVSKFTGYNEIGKSLIYDNGTAIGIGTTSPASKLHLQTTTGNVEHIRMQNTNSTGFGKFLMHNDNATHYATFTKYGSAYAGGYPGPNISGQFPYADLLAFGNNYGPFLLSNNGNVGIGIVSGGSTVLKFNVPQATGYVGLGGSATPAGNIHINNSATGDTVRITNATTGHLNTDGLEIKNTGNAASIINKENSTLEFGTNNATRMTLTAAGNTELSGQIKIAGGAPGVGKVLTSDATGLATWTTAVGGGNISGTGTANYGVRFISPTTIGNGAIYDDAINVGINNNTPHAPLQFANTAANRKEVLYEVANNDHQFFGFGINSGLLRYQVGDIVNNHVFYAGAGAAASNELLRIQGNGNVGIGTATPTTKLEVAGQIKITGGTPGAGKVLTSDAVGLATWTTPVAGGITGSGTAAFVPRFLTATSIGNGMIYDNGTNVGIGTQTPAAKLEVSGQVKITGGAPGAGKVLTSDAVGLATWSTPAAGGITGSGTANYSPRFITPTSIGNGAIFDDGTNVGFGTTTPHAALQLGNNISTRKIVLYENNNNDANFYGFGLNSGIMRYQIGATGASHVFYTGNANNGSNELMRIQGNGNVGIGTDTANAALQFGNVANNRRIVLYENANNDHEFYGFGINSAIVRYQVGNLNSSHVFYAGNGAAASNELLRIKGDGSVGIGTSTPNAPLQFANAQANRKVVLNEVADNDHQFSGMGYNTGIMRYQVGASNFSHVFYSATNNAASAELMRIVGTGNVGIGTAAPTQRLHVFNGTSNGTYTTTGWMHSSDLRLKTNIKPLESALDKITNLKGVSFNWKTIPNTNNQIGFIAQDVEKIFPEVVVVDSDGNYTMAYQNLVAPMVEAIKELNQNNKEQAKIIDILIKRLELLEKK